MMVFRKTMLRENYFIFLFHSEGGLKKHGSRYSINDVEKNEIFHSRVSQFYGLGAMHMHNSTIENSSDVIDSNI